MSVPENLYSEKSFGTVKAQHVVKCITFRRSKTSPDETLYASVRKLNEEVLVPGALAPCIDIDLSGGHANNFLVQNVFQALFNKMVVNKHGTKAASTLVGRH